jgi:hypothetical protein
MIITYGAAPDIEVGSELILVTVRRETAGRSGNGRRGGDLDDSH